MIFAWIDKSVHKLFRKAADTVLTTAEVFRDELGPANA